MEHSEVLRRGRQIIDQTREKVSAALTRSRHILHVQKHDSIGCALVTFTSPEAGLQHTSKSSEVLSARIQACHRLLHAGNRLDIGAVVADVKRHTDKTTGQPSADTVFIAWGRQQELPLRFQS